MELMFIRDYWYEAWPSSMGAYEADCERLLRHLKIPDQKSGIYLATSNAGAGASIMFWRAALDQGVAFASPGQFPWTLANGACSYLSRALGCTGPNYTLAGKASALLACVKHAIHDLLQYEIDYACVVGIDFCLNLQTKAGGILLTREKTDKYICTSSRSSHQPVDHLLVSELMEQITTGLQKRRELFIATTSESPLLFAEYAKERIPGQVSAPQN